MQDVLYPVPAREIGGQLARKVRPSGASGPTLQTPPHSCSVCGSLWKNVPHSCEPGLVGMKSVAKSRAVGAVGKFGVVISMGCIVSKV
jgi:hypothetical protein